MPSVALVILNWNGIKDTLKCLDSLRSLTYKNFEIIVVDNASTDDSLTHLRNYTGITLIQNSVNKGFAGGVNTGITYAQKKNYTYVALLNNDATPDPDWLSNLVKAAETHRDASIVTGLLLNIDGTYIDSTAEQYSVWGMPFPRLRGELFEKAPESGYVFGGSGGATLYRVSLFDTIDLFDETFFCYYEDADLSFRAQLSGIRAYYERSAIAYHKQGASSKKIPGFTVYQTFKNLPLVYIKNIPGKLLIKVGFRFFLMYFLMFGNAIKEGSGAYALKGLFVGTYFFWTKSIWRRHKIQKHRIVSADTISSLMYHDIPPNQTKMRQFRNFFIH